MNSFQLKPGTPVVVKFEEDSIPFRYQGAGWHSGVICAVGEQGCTVQLDKPKKGAIEVFEGRAPVYPLSTENWLNSEFKGTIVRKVPKTNRIPGTDHKPQLPAEEKKLLKQLQKELKK